VMMQKPLAVYDTNSQTSVLLQAKIEQEFFCDHIFPFLKNQLNEFVWVPHINASGVTFGMYVYMNNDFVSNDIRALGAWDLKKLRQFQKLLKKFARLKNLTKSQVIYIDIGANIGWFSFAIASLGYQVIAFEPLLDNEILIRSSLCRNPTLMSNITFVNKGLGEKAQKCLIYSHDKNIGDGHTLCGSHELNRTDWEIRSTIEIVRLDDVLFEGKTGFPLQNVGLVKIDTEGHEPYLLIGASRSLLNGPIPIQCVEMFQQSKHATFQTYRQSGFRIFDTDLITEVVSLKGENRRIYDVFVIQNSSVRNYVISF